MLTYRRIRRFYLAFNKSQLPLLWISCAIRFVSASVASAIGREHILKFTVPTSTLPLSVLRHFPSDLRLLPAFGLSPR